MDESGQERISTSQTPKVANFGPLDGEFLQEDFLQKYSLQKETEKNKYFESNNGDSSGSNALLANGDASNRLGIDRDDVLFQSSGDVGQDSMATLEKERPSENAPKALEGKEGRGEGSETSSGMPRKEQEEGGEVECTDGQKVVKKSTFSGKTAVTLLCGLPICIVIVILGSIKAVITVLPTVAVITAGNTGIAVGLFPWTVKHTYRAVWLTRQLQPAQKIPAMFLLFIPLILWPIVVFLLSIIGSFFYGFCAPILATFEVFHKYSRDHLSHLFKDGLWDTWQGAAKVVRDFGDFSFHSYGSYLEEFEKKECNADQPTSLRFLLIPGCMAVSLLGLFVDTIIVSLLACIKCLLLLLVGWLKLIKSALVQEGPVQIGICIPMTLVAFLVWPCAVIMMVLGAILTSPFVGLYAAVVAYQESSVYKGSLYILAVASDFDDYSSKLIGLHYRSCIPRPEYRSKNSPRNVSVVDLEKGQIPESESRNSVRSIPSSQFMIRTGSQGSLSDGLFTAIVQHTAVWKTLEKSRVLQAWKSLFLFTRQMGQELCDSGFLEEEDLQQWISAKKTTGSTVAGSGLVGLCLVRMLYQSHKYDSQGLLLFDGTEIIASNSPRDLYSDWFLEPLLELKEQLREARMTPEEELYLEAWVLTLVDEDRFVKWMAGVPSPPEGARKNEVESFGRRIQGMAISMTRMPSFRRRHHAVLLELLNLQRKSFVHNSIGNSRSRSAPNLMV